MATGTKLPTSGGRRRGAPRAPDHEPEHSVRAPRAPRGLSRAQATARKELWAQPIARYWAPTDDVFVVRLVRLREQLDELAGEAPLGMYAAVLALERTLYLTPAARRERLKLAVADPPPASGSRPSSSSTGGPARPTSARERERLLRG